MALQVVGASAAPLPLGPASCLHLSCLGVASALSGAGLGVTDGPARLTGPRRACGMARTPVGAG